MEIQEESIMQILALNRKKLKPLSSCYHLNDMVPAVWEKASNCIALKRTLTRQTVQRQLLYRELLPDYTICFTSNLKPQTTYILGKIQIKSALDYSHSFHSI